MKDFMRTCILSRQLLLVLKSWCSGAGAQECACKPSIKHLGTLLVLMMDGPPGALLPGM